ncbi:GH1 family beta-glucosidase [Oleiagrimonas citrea]|nr:GH1 family beta-glucosidase [Oleiagrimonas citrea]
MPENTRFPESFLWGCATSAYQIEGSPLADGAGPSMWERFAHTPGMMHNDDNGDIACDHYRRFRDDVRLMRDLGLTSYRFSIAWSRILPSGTGAINQKGLDFYRQLVDALLEGGITPMATLYHWDLPEALDDRGGWLNRDCADWFAEYASTCFEALDDRVPRWVTLNEPWVVTDGGYLHGVLAPGHRNPYETARASHNLMRAHGAAVQAYRAVGAHQIGLVVNLEPKYPASESAEDRAATQRADAYMNRQYLDPALKGTYPPEMREIFGDAWPDWPAADFEQIRQPIDFLGINYYTRGLTAHDPSAWPLYARTVRVPQATYTETDWEVHEESFTDILRWVRDRYGDIPLYVTENGAAFYDPPVAADDGVHDPLRIDYLRRHLRAVHTAIKQGADVRGYYLWSLLDNLEWSLGFAKRFGIVHVNYETLERTPKDSAKFYAEVIASHGESLSEPRTK